MLLGTVDAADLPAGLHEIVVTYTGLEPVRRSLTVAVDQRAAQDFELTSAIYKLDAFTVAGEREGGAAVITAQRNAANVKNVVALDAFVTDYGADVARWFVLSDSPPDSPEEIAALGRNQHRTAAFGRESGLRLERGDREVLLVEWAAELLEGFAPIAQRLDAAFGGHAYREALALATRALDLSALSSAAPAAPRTVLWESATNR